MKRVFLVAVVLWFLLVVGCKTTGPIEPTVNPETFIVVDRQTGKVYYPDLDPKPEIEGGRITFIENGKAYILSGNWLVRGDLDGD